MSDLKGFSLTQMLEKKYQSLLFLSFLIILALGLSVMSLTVYALLNQVSNALSTWVSGNKASIEEALFLKNYQGLHLRTEQVNKLSPTIATAEFTIYGPDKANMDGVGAFPSEPLDGGGLSLDVPAFRVSYFAPLYFGGTLLGYLWVSLKLRLLILLTIAMIVFVVGLVLFSLLRNLLRSFLLSLKSSVADPILELHQQMRHFDLAQPVMPLTAPPQTVLEISELYRGYEDLMNRALAGVAIEAEKKEAEAILKITSQVAHDIRSPLVALGVATKDLSPLEEFNRVLIRNAIARITDIANGLLTYRRDKLKNQTKVVTFSTDLMRTTWLLPLLEVILAEKRVQYRSRSDLQISFKQEGSEFDFFGEVEASEFKTLLSNLINNAVESISDKGEVTVTLRSSPRGVTLLVKDTGSGIPTEILQRLNHEDLTFGKTGGSGLGLSHAKACAGRWKGSLRLESQMGKGTEVTLELPKADRPQWFVREIALTPTTAVVIVDDDPNMHQIWKGIFADSTSSPVSITHLNSPPEFHDWLAKNPSLELTRFFIDYHFQNHAETGLDLIRRHRIEKQSVLVTSSYADPEVLKAAQETGLPLLPKPLLTQVRLKFA